MPMGLILIVLIIFFFIYLYLSKKLNKAYSKDDYSKIIISGEQKREDWENVFI